MKEYRVIKVTDYSVPHGVKPELVVKVWKNGMIEIRERCRRVEYSATVGSVYVGALKREVMEKKKQRKRGKSFAGV